MLKILGSSVPTPVGKWTAISSVFFAVILGVLCGLSESALAAQRLGSCYKGLGSCLSRSEQTVLLAKTLMAKVIGTCIRPSRTLAACELDAEEDRTLRAILASLPEEMTQGRIEFVSESAQPGFFFLDGQVRVAKTGDQVGDPVFFNTDIINTSMDFDVFTAVGLLIHEFGHHHRISDHQWLDRLGAKIKTVAGDFTLGVPFDLPSGEHIEVSILNHSAFHESSILDLSLTNATVLVWDGSDYTILDSGRDLGLCTSGDRPVVKGVWLENFYGTGPLDWGVVSYPTPQDLRSAHIQRLRGRLFFGCAASEDSRAAPYDQYDLNLELFFRRTGDGARDWGSERGFIPEVSKASLINCAGGRC